ncbi:hypothetical protein [Spiroplasma endosymbiont of Crioceris asparagi]|uniref:hypothetical protein n=1 Tax=Spiroplasma endosymbiont of Crioceris asparagi TaxID=3066286 RepID=UPI0030CEBED6
MKKIIALSGLLLVSANLPLLLVSCQAKEYKDFLSHINNHESFVAMLGAKDDDKTKNFEKVIKDDLFKTRFNYLMGETVTDYNNNKGKSDGDSKSHLTGWGEEVKTNPLNLYTYKSKEKASLHQEKFAKQIDSWLNDRLFDYWDNGQTNPYKNQNKQQNKDYVKKYLEGLEQSPMFILIRNGKLVWISNAFDLSIATTPSQAQAQENMDNWFGYDGTKKFDNPKINKEGIYYKFAQDDKVYTNIIDAIKKANTN